MCLIPVGGASAPTAPPLCPSLIVILALVQVSRATAHKHKNSDGTRAVMTVNGFQKGEDGGGASECDGKYHSNDDLIVALSTGWYAGGSRCHRKIRITSTDTGRTVNAKVVDECDCRRGCKHNIVDSSKAVWKELGLDTRVGQARVTWSDA